MKTIITSALLIALVLPATAVAKSSGLPAQVAALQRQVNAQTKQIANLQNAVAEMSGTVGSDHASIAKTFAVEECHFALLATIDYSFLDLFEVYAGEPESYAGQTVPDNGNCAAAGMTPLSPTASTRLGAQATPARRDMRSSGSLPGMIPP